MTPDSKTCRRCKRPLAAEESTHATCLKCAEVDMATKLGAGILGLPASWFPTDDEADK